jgi:DNA-binding NarL/FixJ family response regulator
MAERWRAIIGTVRGVVAAGGETMQETKMIRIVLADDHHLFRRGLRQLIELEPDIKVVAEATNGVEAVRALTTHRPDVLLLDLSMPILDGLGVLAAARRDHPTVGVLVLTMHGEESIVLHALAAGAAGLARKDSDTNEVIGAIRAIADGRAWLDSRATAVLLEEYRRLNALVGRAATGRLSERDLTLLRLLAGGHTNKEIAGALGIADSTVKNQLGALFDRIGVRDRTQAALYAFNQGVLAPDQSDGVARVREER